MAIFRGPSATKVTTALIDSVTIHGGTIESQGDDGDNGSYSITFKHVNTGCGSADSGILILLTDDIPWTRIGFEWLGNGTASCWSFMHNGTNYGSSTGTATGNMAGYDESQGDGITRPYLSWEVEDYQSHNRTYACDNNANNFLRFNGGSYKSFRMARRRSTTSSLAGIHHGRSCNGANTYTIIKNIYIW